jgi:poly-gamma-glutamate capsule biosynthesis protein CapA/YwtB (metallophosphatase superfamily)
MKIVRIFVAVAVFSVSGAAVAKEGAPELRTATTLPSWRAPGGAFTVEGSAEGGAAVGVTSGRLVLGTDRAETSGRFRVVAHAPARSGRYRLSVTAGGVTESLGLLLVRPVRIAAGGDFTPGDRIAELAASRGARYAWRSVGPLLRAADIATVNLEGVVSSRGSPVPDKQFHFRGPRSVLAGAVDAAGLDVVTVANNHSLDFGPSAFLDTVAALRALRVASVGGGANLAKARRPAIIEAGGLRIAFLGYSDVVPYGFGATSSSPGTAVADSAAIRADIGALRKRADLVVCWFHWGEELATMPTSREQEFASACLNAGAKLVLGSHPHVLQPIARPSPRLLVAFSLGNFVFPAGSPGTQRTGVLEVDVASDGVRGFRLRPATIVDGQPRLSEPPRRRR